MKCLLLSRLKIFISFQGLNNDDQDIKLIDQTNTIVAVNQTTKNHIENQHSSIKSVTEKRKKRNKNFV
jgi:hypothetical protein